MIKQSKYIFLSLMLGALFVLLFFNKSYGISFPLFMTALTLFLLYILKDHDLLHRNSAWWFLIPLFLMSFRFFLSTNHIMNFFNQNVIILFFAGMAILLVSKKHINWGGSRFLAGVVERLAVSVIFVFKPFGIIFEKLNFIKNSKLKSTIAKVLTALVISIPLLFIIILLLSSADDIFSQTIAFIPEKIGFFFNSENWSKLIVALIVGFYIFSFLYIILNEKVKDDQKDELLPVEIYKKLELDSTIVITVLSLINIVYILFCYIQFSYLFGGADSILPKGLTYSQYARKGFFELIFVSIMNFSIVLGIISSLLKKNGTVKYIISSLLTLLGGSTFIMLYSSYYRMRLYQENYGYTYLRIFVYFFLTLEAIMLAGTLLYILIPKFNLMKLYIVSFLICFVALNYINIDGLIAKSNIDKYFITGHIDVDYLTKLSYDSVPQMTRLTKVKDERISKKVKVYLDNAKTDLNSKYSWFEFNLSVYNAVKALEQ